MRKKTVYVAHPIVGDYYWDKFAIHMICRDLALAGEVIPCAPYIEACDYLDFYKPEDRRLIDTMDEELIIRGALEEVWLYGDNVSEHMESKIRLALDLRIPVVPKTARTGQALIPLLAPYLEWNPRDSIRRYLMRTGPIGMDDLRRWVWKHFPGDIVVVNKMIGERLLHYHGEGRIGVPM